MGYIEGTPREQSLLFPERLDDYIDEGNPVRFIDAYVDQLDLEALGFARSRPAQTGRPPYRNGDMLKLYLYGYTNRIRSSRMLERESGRNVELIWLMRQLKPDFKTIADFRRENKRAFREVFRDFVKLCRKLEMFGGDLVAIDGTKLKAVNNKDRNFTDRFVKRKLKEIDEKIDRYLDELDQSDKESGPRNGTLSGHELKTKISALKDRKETYSTLHKEMKETGKKQLSLTDQDSRAFPEKFKVGVGYNAQVAVDDKHHLIAVEEVTNEVTDVNLLGPMSVKAKEALEVETLKVVADAGYSNSVHVTLCEKAGIEAYTPRIATSRNRKQGLYTKDMFRYDPKEACYWCPAGEKLALRFKRAEMWRNRKRLVGVYECARACHHCPQHAQCTTAGHRRITRPVEDDAIDRMAERMKAHPEIMRKRKQIVEHVFGTIKFWNGQGYFLTRGLDGVQAEFSLSALSYNLKRAIKIMGVKNLIAALG